MGKRFKIGGVPEHFNLPWRISIEESLFRNQGIELHWSDMTGGTGQMIKGLETGSLDIAVLLTEGVTMSILKGLKAKIISVYVESPLRWGIHVAQHSKIKDSNDLKNKVFAISREGSGSHLMTYVHAHQEGWDLSEIGFNVVGDIFGGLWALQNNVADGFLWEKYTTYPYVEKKKCKRIGEVLTPWPCFVIAVRQDVLDEYKEEINSIRNIVLDRAKKLKQDTNAPEIFAWRYNLKIGEVKKWLNQTNWSVERIINQEKFNLVIDYLLATNLIEKEDMENWREKLF